MGIRVALFDAGNTLIHIHYAVIAEALTRHGFAVGEGAVRRAEQRARVRLDPILANITSTERDGVFETYMRLVMEGLSIPSSAPVLRDVLAEITRYNQVENLWNQPSPQAGPVLAELKRRGLRLGVISNSDGTVERILRQHGIADLCEVILDSTKVGVEKPDPRIFRMAIERMKVEPAEAVYVGDLYSVDILGSRAAGLTGILLDPLGAWGEVDCPTARDLEEVAALLTGPRQEGGAARTSR